MKIKIAFTIIIVSLAMGWSGFTGMAQADITDDCEDAQKISLDERVDGNIVPGDLDAWRLPLSENEQVKVTMEVDIGEVDYRPSYAFFQLGLRGVLMTRTIFPLDIVA